MINQNLIFKFLFCFCFCLFGPIFVNSEIQAIPNYVEKYYSMNPDQISKNYNLQGLGLNGSIASITCYSVSPVYKFGELIDEKKKELYQYEFDENGNLSAISGDYKNLGLSQYVSVESLPSLPASPSVSNSELKSDTYKSKPFAQEIKPEISYFVFSDSTLIYSSGKLSQKNYYKKDDSGRIIEVYTLIPDHYSDSGYKESKLIFSYNGDGYSFENWLTPTFKTVGVKKGNKFYYDPNRDFSDKLELILNKDGKIITDSRQEYKFEYNNHGDLTSVTRCYPITNKYAGEVIEKEEWEYVYDDKGNWIERKGFKSEGSPNQRLILWEKRDITYLSPEQIRAKNMHKRIVEEERQRKIIEDYNDDKNKEL